MTFIILQPSVSVHVTLLVVLLSAHLYFASSSFHHVSPSFDLHFASFDLIFIPSSFHSISFRFTSCQASALLSFSFVKFNVLPLRFIPCRFSIPFQSNCSLLFFSRHSSYFPSFIRFIPGHFQFHSSSIHSCSTNNIHLLPPSFLAPPAR